MAVQVRVFRDNHHISKSKAVDAAFTDHSREGPEHIVGIEEVGCPTVCQYNCRKDNNNMNRISNKFYFIIKNFFSFFSSFLTENLVYGHGWFLPYHSNIYVGFRSGPLNSCQTGWAGRNLTALVVTKKTLNREQKAKKFWSLSGWSPTNPCVGPIQSVAVL